MARAGVIRVRHYIVSSGNSEIIEGTPIASNFERIYASKFLFDPNGVPIWPALAVNFTNKTQYLFRINKGAHDLSDDRQINAFVDKGKRPIPFENMVYIGDGSTDVPCFRLVKEQGGLSIAVFKPNTRGAQESADSFRRDGRVHRVAPAVYTEGSELDATIKTRDRSDSRQTGTREDIGGAMRMRVLPMRVDFSLGPNLQPALAWREVPDTRLF